MDVPGGGDHLLCAAAAPRQGNGQYRITYVCPDAGILMSETSIDKIKDDDY